MSTVKFFKQVDNEKEKSRIFASKDVGKRKILPSQSKDLSLFKY